MSSQNVAVVPSITPDKPITLQVGERRFTTTVETLTQGSAFFASMLSGRWNGAQEDGAYFIDADGGLFEHILRYLRRGICPVFYDNIKGHDYALYFAVLEEAKYFQIPRLEEWLKDRKYLEVVKIFSSAEELEGVGAISATTADVNVEYHPHWTSKKVYICPRRTSLHRGDPDRCGRLCRNAQGDAEDEYEEEPVLRTVVIRREAFFNWRMCVEER